MKTKNESVDLNKNTKLTLEQTLSSKEENEAVIDLGPSYEIIKKDISSIIKIPIDKWSEKDIAKKIDEVIETYKSISIYNNINFNDLIDNVVLPMANNHGKNYNGIKRKFEIKYRIENKNNKRISGFKTKEKKLGKKLIEFKKKLTDYEFTLRLILEIENLENLIGKGIDEIGQEGYNINIGQSLEKDELIYTQKFNREDIKKKRMSSDKGFAVIHEIHRRVKQTKGLGKKANDIINKLHDVPQKLYEDAYTLVMGEECNPSKYKDTSSIDGINEKKLQQTVKKIHEYLTFLDTNEKSKKIKKNVLTDAIFYHLDIMLGRPDEPNKKSYKNKEIDSQYQKDKIENKLGNISDLFAGTIILEKNRDINKVRDFICFSYFGQNPGDCYATNKEFNSRATNPNFDGVVQIKDYRGDTAKKNSFKGIQMRIRHGGTDMELLLMTKENYENSKKGPASHTKYKFFQRLMREVSFYDNINQKIKYDAIMRFFAKTK